MSVKFSMCVIPLVCEEFQLSLFDNLEVKSEDLLADLPGATFREANYLPHAVVSTQ